MSVRVGCVVIVGSEVPTKNVINESIAVVIDAVPSPFARVSPDCMRQIGMKPINACIQHRNHNAFAGVASFPGLRSMHRVKIPFSVATEVFRFRKRNWQPRLLWSCRRWCVFEGAGISRDCQIITADGTSLWMNQQIIGPGRKVSADCLVGYSFASITMPKILIRIKNVQIKIGGQVLNGRFHGRDI